MQFFYNKLMDVEEVALLKEKQRNVVFFPKRLDAIINICNSSYLLRKETSDLFDEDLDILFELRQSLDEFPQNWADLDFMTKAQLIKADKFVTEHMADINAVQRNVLEKAKHETTIGRRNVEKTIYGIKDKGSLGFSFVQSQLAYLFAKEFMLLGIDLDPLINNEEQGPAIVLGAFENNLKFYMEYFEKKLAKIASPESHIHDLMAVHGKNRKTEYQNYIHKGHADLLPNLHILKYKQLRKIDEFTALFILLRLYVGFAESLMQYKMISFDSGPLNDSTQGFYSQYIDNHFVFTNINNKEIVDAAEGRSSNSGIITSYKQIIENNKSSGEKRILLGINARNKGEMKYYEQTKSAESKIREMFTKTTGISQELLDIVLIPFLSEANPSNNKKDMIQIPIAVDPRSGINNEEFKQSIYTLKNHIISMLPQD